MRLKKKKHRKMKIFNEKLHSEFLFYKKVDGECAIHLLLLIPRKLTLSPCLSENNFILLSLFMNIFAGCRIPSCIVLYFLSKCCRQYFIILKHSRLLMRDLISNWHLSLCTWLFSGSFILEIVQVLVLQYYICITISVLGVSF